MIKLTLPKRPHTGIKIFCKKCRIDNSKCRHYDQQVYRVRIHVPGSEKSVKVRTLEAKEYKEAVSEALDFEKELIANNFSTIKNTSEEGNDYSVLDACIKYNQYLNGESHYAHLKKNISKGYKDELIRYCRHFSKNVKLTKDIKTYRVRDIGRNDVSSFYKWAENHYNEKTFNKCMAGVKGFFEFLIDEEDIVMKNPFRKYTVKQVVHAEINSVTKAEFNSILKAVDTYESVVILGGKGERKDMFKHYLKNGFRLFLLIGGRREEIVNLRWSDIFISPNGTKFFRIENLKVMRAKKKKEKIYKYTPVNNDLFDLLIEMGYHEKKDTDDYILFPERENAKSLTICNNLSKAFTHYRKGAAIEKDISLSNLRKTYLTWVNQVMNQDTKILSSHSTDGVLKEYYLDPTVLTAIEKGALEIKIFG